MKRVVEPELMEDETQAIAYAEADFAQPHAHFIALFRQHFPALQVRGPVIDLGCGPGDIALRFARAFPESTVHGLDGSPAMLAVGERGLAQAGEISQRVRLIEGMLPDAAMPLPQYEVVISNSLLHHLHDPRTLWRAVRRYAAPRAAVFIMDLRRPATREQAEQLRAQYVSTEPAILQRDFTHSLLAAFEPEEIRVQLAEAGLSGLTVTPSGDRHVIVYGIV